KQQGRHLDAVALSQGPGSYTGLRIGTATAKGLCYGMDLPLFAVDTLQAIAMSARQRDSDAGSETLYCPMIDARRMEVYTALYDAHLNQAMPVEARIITQDSLSSLSAGREVVLCGNGAGKCRPMLPQGMIRLMENIVPEARYVAELASDAARGYQAVDLAYFNPFYLKEFQAVVSKNKLW
ncbi:MAG: tRNA (adenosine(37)-N6)-threonylcarbamoyltransferase complex dimerization subunit type 1 TsaB, partial [Paludibacteraceae bacterium]|nr:tRNA (adenosine(37)-N6)-threonylcarbamoyltransferase complex dimerization subunit type 1 TsaB [Paludibacteraceae bacterium]